MQFQTTALMMLTNAVNMNSTTWATRDLCGEVGELIFQLSIPASEPPLDQNEPSRTRIWIDDVRLGPVGAPLQAEMVGPSADELTIINPATLTPLLEVSRLAWGNMVEAPNGIGGMPFGSIGVAATLADIERANAGEYWTTGGHDGGIDNQGLFTNFIELLLSRNQSTGAAGTGPLVEGVADGTAIAHQIWRDHNAACASDGHAVQAQHNAGLAEGQHVGFWGAIVSPDSIFSAPVEDGGTFINERAVTVANGNVGSNPSPGGSDGPLTGLDIFKLQQLVLEPLIELNTLGWKDNGLGPQVLIIDQEAGLRKSDNQQDQNSAYHHPSFGTPTLPPDRDSSNGSGALSAGEPALSTVEGVTRKTSIGAWDAALVKQF